jgi:hypothetical protein
MIYMLNGIKFNIELRYEEKIDKTYCANVLYIYTALHYGENVEYSSGVPEDNVEELKAALANGTFTLEFKYDYFLILFKYGNKSLPLEGCIMVSASLESSFYKHRKYLEMEKELNEFRAQLGKPAITDNVTHNFMRVYTSQD